MDGTAHGPDKVAEIFPSDATVFWHGHESVKTLAAPGFGMK